MNRWIAIAWVALPRAAMADPSQLARKDARGRNVVLANCTMCHSVDYVLTNSPFPDRKLWEAEVAKTRNAFKAPISDADARTIVDCLAVNRGSDAMKAAAKWIEWTLMPRAAARPSRRSVRAARGRAPPSSAAC